MSWFTKLILKYFWYCLRFDFMHKGKFIQNIKLKFIQNLVSRNSSLACVNLSSQGSVSRNSCRLKRLVKLDVNICADVLFVD